MTELIGEPRARCGRPNCPANRMCFTVGDCPVCLAAECACEAHELTQDVYLNQGHNVALLLELEQMQRTRQAEAEAEDGA